LFLVGRESPEPLQDRVDGERKVVQMTGKKGVAGQVQGYLILQGGERVELVRWCVQQIKTTVAKGQDFVERCRKCNLQIIRPGSSAENCRSRQSRIRC